MSKNKVNTNSSYDLHTRRDVIKKTGAVVSGGAITGCIGESNQSNIENSEAESKGTVSDTSYEACIEPAGCINFEKVPETWLCYNGGWADMAFALGKRDGFLTAANMIPGFMFEPFGLDVPPEEETTSLSTVDWDKEIFYEMDPDVILMDPNYMHATGWDGSWKKEDTEELRENVAPFFGNNILRRRDWHDYKMYTLYEALERLADLFRERERYEALNKIHTDLQSKIQSKLPPKEKRPNIALINSASDPKEGTFYPMDTQVEGVEMKPYRDLDIGSVFPSKMVEEGTIDYEELLEVDPEIIVVHWGIGVTGDQNSFSVSAFKERYLTPMKEDSVGSRLTAVKNGNIYPGAFGSQGPLVNLLQTEMVAQQMYPYEFGEFEISKFPDVSREKRLFDRKKVKSIVKGNF